MTVYGRDHRGGFTRDIDQDGCCGPPIHRAIIYRCQHDQRRWGWHAKHQGQQYGNRTGGAETGQYTDHGPNQAAAKGDHQIKRGEGNAETVEKTV